MRKEQKKQECAVKLGRNEGTDVGASGKGIV